MKKKKQITVNVDILEEVGDGDRYLVRYFVPELGLQAVEWVSVAGVTQWLSTSSSTTMKTIMEAIKDEIEKSKKEVKEDASKADSDQDSMD